MEKLRLSDHERQNQPANASAIRKYNFPYRTSVEQLRAAYESLEKAFDAHDYLYVARFGHSHPELHACALLMLGNKVGGERILERHKIHTSRSCCFQAYAAWQDGDKAAALKWIAEGRVLGADPRFDKFETLINRETSRVLLYYDYHNKHFVEAFENLPDIETVLVPHLSFPLDQSLKTAVPDGKAIDLVLLDDFKFAPLGVRDIGAPVAVWAHDIEWYYEYLDQIIPEVDLVILGATSEALELGRAFHVNTSVYFYPIHMSLPEYGTLQNVFRDVSGKTTDIFYSGSIGYDFYLYKKQQILGLTELDSKYKVRLEEGYSPIEELWNKIEDSRFSIMSSRNTNYVSTRAIEAIANGALYITEEEDAFPHLFSEDFTCFPIYRREHICADVEKHLNSYDAMLSAFRSQLPQFEKEFNSLLSRDKKVRTQRFLRHALFMAHVENGMKPPTQTKPARDMVYINEYNHFNHDAAAAAQYLAQIKPGHWLRHAYGVKAVAMAQKKPDAEMFGDLERALQEGIVHAPNSLALHYVLGLCQWYLDKDESAEENFIKVTSGSLRLTPDDVMPIDLGKLTSFYWVNDARIRERCPKDTAPLIAPEDVVMAYAWAYRAQLERRRGQLDKARECAAQSLELFPYNEDVQKLYLRILFNLIDAGGKEWEDVFLEAYEAGSHNDHTILHDFAAPAFHILFAGGQVEAAMTLLEKLKLYISRTKLFHWQHALYPEIYPYIQRYQIPHTGLNPMGTML